jgi:hypothetical protein
MAPLYAAVELLGFIRLNVLSSGSWDGKLTLKNGYLYFAFAAEKAVLGPFFMGIRHLLARARVNVGY